MPASTPSVWAPGAITRPTLKPAGSLTPASFLPPVKDPILGVTKYPFRHGQTTISLFKIGNNLPADTGSAGIQYIISNIDAMNARALAEKVTVETPLGGLQGFPGLKTVWLNDPDGVTDYFYQMDRRPAGQAQAAAPAEK